jgi:hypothetical protein
MALGLTQQARVFSEGKCGRCLRLITLSSSCAVVKKAGNLNFLEPSGPLQALNGTALPLLDKCGWSSCRRGHPLLPKNPGTLVPWYPFTGPVSQSPGRHSSYKHFLQKISTEICLTYNINLINFILCYDTALQRRNIREYQQCNYNHC